MSGDRRGVKNHSKDGENKRGEKKEEILGRKLFPVSSLNLKTDKASCPCLKIQAQKRNSYNRGKNRRMRGWRKGTRYGLS